MPPTIPKIIHQTAKTTEIPAKWQGFQKKMRDLHPDWTYCFHTDEDNLQFVRKEFPEFLDVYLNLPLNIMRADVIRYLLMYRVGGLYADMDYEMLKPFDFNEHDIVLPWEHDGDMGPGKDQLCNAFFASSPGHPFFKMAIDDLMAHPPLDPDPSHVIQSTGPAFLTRIYHRAIASGMTLYTPHRQVFSPLSPHSPRQYRAILKNPATYGIHHCTGSWRQYSRARRIRMHITGFIKRRFC
ncbi:MAG: glycosyltransferase [Phycisphaeraceae bacterium]